MEWNLGFQAALPALLASGVAVAPRGIVSRKRGFRLTGAASRRQRPPDRCSDFHAEICN
jgi:hypothetical protein